MTEFPIANDGYFVKRSKALELYWSAITILIGWDGKYEDEMPMTGLMKVRENEFFPK
jgi:hypothetical protein